MNITDLSEVKAQFQIDTDNTYWDYTFYAKVDDDYEYMQSMNANDLMTLKENCQKIISLIEVKLNQ